VGIVVTAVIASTYTDQNVNLVWIPWKDESTSMISAYMQDEMLPPEHMERMHKMLLAQQGRVTWVPLQAGHMDAYETAAQVS
jgi:predicted esterase